MCVPEIVSVFYFFCVGVFVFEFFCRSANPSQPYRGKRSPVLNWEGGARLGRPMGGRAALGHGSRSPVVGQGAGEGGGWS